MKTPIRFDMANAPTLQRTPHCQPATHPRQKTSLSPKQPKLIRAVSLLLYASLCIPSLNGGFEDDIDEIRAGNLEATDAWFADKQAAARTNEHWLLLPRIVIDTKEQAVTFKAEATGLAANEIIEFYLIGERSGNAYEAIAVALAEPADIAAAIEKLGLPRGQHADPRSLRFWPKGERVHLYLDEHRAPDLLLDRRTGSSASRDGFVFTASRKVKRDGQKQLAAQVEAPFSIASNYNEPNTVLDVPFRAPQSEVYAEQVQNPDIRFEPGKLLTVRIVPERTDGSRRVRVMDLILTATEDTTRALPIADVRFTLQEQIDDQRQTHLDNAPLQTFVQHIRDRVADRQDPFVTLHVAPELSLMQANSAARMLEAMENEENLRILPPPENALFYRAFMPDESRRDRSERIAHPWELHLSHQDPPTLVYIKENWVQGEWRPQIETEDIIVKQPDTLADMMKERRPDINAVFIYAPEDMLVGDIMEKVQHFQQSHPLIHIFMEPPPRGQTSDATPAATSE